MRVLVTGHCGYIGRHVFSSLTDQGHEVFGHDAADTSQTECPDIVRRGDLEARQRRHAPFDAVIHLAALSQAGESMGPLTLRYWDVNAGGTRNLLTFLKQVSPIRKAGGFCGRLIFASSCAAADPASSPYAASKYACELMITQAARAYNFSAINLRLFNVAGNLDTTSSRIIPSACAAARDGSTLTLFGGHPTPDGTAVRDYVHVEDVAEAFTRALAAPLGPREALTLDIGSGVSTSVLGAVAAVCRASGKRVRTELRGTSRPGDRAEAVADVGEAARVLGWRATKGLDEIAASAWESSGEEKS